MTFFEIFLHPPNHHAGLVLILTLFALFLFSRDNLPIETSALVVLVLLIVGFELFPYQANNEILRGIDFFHGFGHEALITVTALMVAGQSLIRTGALEPLGYQLAHSWVKSPKLTLLLTLVIAAFLSAFMNNTPIVILLLPILVGVSLKTARPASAVLMPMGFATLLGGMSTSIGTSTNLLVVGVAADLGVAHFEMFDFVLPAVMAGSLGILYLWLIAPRILPIRATPLSETSPRIFSAEILMTEESCKEQSQLSHLLKKMGSDFNIIRITRGQNNKVTVPLPDAKIQVGDRLLIRDTPNHLFDYAKQLKGRLYSGNLRLTDPKILKETADQQLAEIVVVPGSLLAGETLQSIRFAARYDLITLALHRDGKPFQTSIKRRLNEIPLRVGDVLLVQGDRTQISKVKRQGDLLVLDATTDIPHTKNAPRSLIIMVAIILFAALGWLPISVSAILGVTVMLTCGCLKWRDVGQAISPTVILIIVTSLALGNALIKTGGTDYLVHLFMFMTDGLSPVFILSALILVMAIITNIVSNNAAAVIGTPIAIGIAQQLELPAEAFLLAVLFGANMSFITPMSYKTNLLVMGAGGYKFSDFVRVGLPLTLILWLAFSIILPWLYPFS